MITKQTNTTPIAPLYANFCTKFRANWNFQKMNFVENSAIYILQPSNFKLANFFIELSPIFVRKRLQDWPHCDIFTGSCHFCTKLRANRKFQKMNFVENTAIYILQPSNDKLANIFIELSPIFVRKRLQEWPHCDIFTQSCHKFRSKSSASRKNGETVDCCREIAKRNGQNRSEIVRNGQAVAPPTRGAKPRLPGAPDVAGNSGCHDNAGGQLQQAPNCQKAPIWISSSFQRHLFDFEDHFIEFFLINWSEMD